VQACLASILGGTSCNFSILQLDEQVFRFRVSCKRVGFLVLQLVSFACDSFKLAFHLCNDNGFQAALAFSKSDSGPSFSWTEVRKKKFGHLSYAQVSRLNRAPLTGANKTPLGTSGAANLASSNIGANSQTSGSPGHSASRFVTPPGKNHEGSINSGRQVPRMDFSGPQKGISGNLRPRISVFNRISFPKRSVFDRLSFRTAQGNRFFQNLNLRSKVQLINQCLKIIFMAPVKDVYLPTTQGRLANPGLSVGTAAKRDTSLKTARLLQLHVNRW
jgi:hypothetical protein